MIAVDTNILVYAHRQDSPFHIRAKRFIEETAGASDVWAIAWPCLHEFYGIVTHPKIYRPASTIDQALDQIDAWLASPSLQLITESGDHWTRLAPQLQAGQVRGPAVHDARIAAICVEHGVRAIVSQDRDFTRFPELVVRSLPADPST